MTFTQIISDLKEEIEGIIKSFDGYGYSREENIKELENRNIDDSGIDEDVMNKYWELKAKLDQTLLCEKIANEELSKNNFAWEVMNNVEKQMYKDFVKKELNFLNYIKTQLINGKATNVFPYMDLGLRIAELESEVGK